MTNFPPIGSGSRTSTATTTAHIALRAARETKDRLDDWIQTWDLPLAPSAVGVPPAGRLATGDPLFNRMWTLLGVPSIALPGASADNGLSASVQEVDAMNCDEQLLAIARRAAGPLLGRFPWHAS